ncbi:MAG: SMP-30/gluconolactonase/LRE family protein, partial [Rhizobiales bacterium]|nr:SMP-30/gluconolactonase/LRE family protein [Hyphomicrobiales bacterium]
GFLVSNGPAVSPDGRLLYFNDSFGRRTLVYDLDPGDPMPRNRRLFAQYDSGVPDGMTVDAEGGVWVAFWEGWRVARYTPEGALSETVALPCPNVTSVCFAGPGLDTLVITTAREGMDAATLAAHPEAGHTFALTPGWTGLAEPAFRI